MRLRERNQACLNCRAVAFWAEPKLKIISVRQYKRGSSLSTTTSFLNQGNLTCQVEAPHIPRTHQSMDMPWQREAVHGDP